MIIVIAVRSHIHARAITVLVHIWSLFRDMFVATAIAKFKKSKGVAREDSHASFVPASPLIFQIAFRETGWTSERISLSDQKLR